MYTNKELEEIYEVRYSAEESVVNRREVALYSKYRKLLLPKDFGKSEDINHLDLGCGRGHKTFGFSHGFKRIVAIDLSNNVIENCKKLYAKSNIVFVAKDANTIDEKFEVITAFGFSLFNTKDNMLFMKNLNHFLKNNLVLSSKSFVLIGSFTDYSGQGEDAWYLHTKADLAFIKNAIQNSGDFKVDILFPHKRIKNYLGFGFYNFLAEIYKLIFKRKKTFFIRIEHG